MRKKKHTVKVVSAATEDEIAEFFKTDLPDGRYVEVEWQEEGWSVAPFRVKKGEIVEDAEKVCNHPALAVVNSDAEIVLLTDPLQKMIQVLITHLEGNHISVAEAVSISKFLAKH